MKYPDGRNPNRGDLHNMHNLVCDALQGLWWDDDSQVTQVRVCEEYLCQPFQGLLFIGGRR